MRKKIVNGLALLLCVMCIFVTGIYTAIELIAYSDSFYERQFEAADVSGDTKISPDDLKLISQEIQHFLKGEREDFDISAPVDGVMTPLFGDQEQFHMKEVQVLFLRFRTVRNLCLILLAALLLWSFWRGVENGFRLLKRASITLLVFLGLVGLGVLFFFEPVFTLFHELLFDNDLWLFPWSSYLIRILPESFFVACGVRIVGMNLILYVLVLVFSLWGLRLRSKRGEKNHER